MIYFTSMRSYSQKARAGRDRFTFLSFILLCGVFIATMVFDANAEKELIYDEEKGIIFVDKDNPGEAGGKTVQKPVMKDAAPPMITIPAETPTQQPKRRTDKNDIHTGRKKDPPELYFSSGLEYFKNKDFKNAMKNFRYADSVSPSPHYSLWIYKTYRQLGATDKMLEGMHRLLEKFPESDVADDALFEIAFNYQTQDDYDMAGKLYTQLAEQYPFGLSYSNGEEFREIAREQRKYMRAELINLLTILGQYTDEDLQVSLRRFQELKGLEVTGTATQKTVRAIKAQHREYLDKEAMIAARAGEARRHLLWVILAGTAAVIMLLLLVITRWVAISKLRQVETLQQAIAELDMRK
jgi:tetratricopeptide (TPR) repeat protein